MYEEDISHQQAFFLLTVGFMSMGLAQGRRGGARGRVPKRAHPVPTHGKHHVVLWLARIQF